MAESANVVNKRNDGGNAPTKRVYYDNYWDAYNSLFESEYKVVKTMSSIKRDENEPIEVDELPQSTIQVEREDINERIVRLYKKNFFSITVSCVALVFFVVIMILSAVSVMKEYTFFFANAGLADLAKAILGANFAKMKAGDTVIAVAIPVTIVLTIVLSLVAMIITFTCFKGSKRTKAVGGLSLIALLAWINVGTMMFFGAGFATDANTIADYLNPMVDIGVQWGYYIVIELLLIPAIFGFFFSFKKCVGIGYSKQK